MINEEFSNEISFDEILKYIKVAKDIVGESWLERKLNEEKEKLKKDQVNSRKGKFDYLYRNKAHQIVLWEIEYDKWRKDCIRTKNLEMSEELLRYVYFGYILHCSRGVIGFDKLISRLKNKEKFQATVFEIEIATGYVNSGFKVEFIEEGSEKTPDLKVELPNGEFFFAECKYKNIRTEKEEVILSKWNMLEKKILNRLDGINSGVAIVIQASSGFENKDVDNLTELIMHRIDSIDSDIALGESVKPIPTSDGKFQIVVCKIPDQDGGIQNLNVKCSREISHSKLFFTNELGVMIKPVFLGLIIDDVFDNVKGVVQSFKSAVKQIPENGPGVIFIRIDDFGWSSKLRESFDEVKRLIEKEFSGCNNTRVNAVIIKTRRVVQGDEATNYFPIDLRIDHPSPKVNLNYKLPKLAI